MKAQIIYNPVAGQRDVHREIAQVVQHLQARGWDVQALQTHFAGEATQYARRAVDNGYRLILAAGGDGTLNEVVNGVVGSETAVGILPVGTGNVWAKEIGVPVSTTWHAHRLLEAAKVLAEGRVLAVDVGCANGRYFLLWAGVGFDAQVVTEIEPQYETKRRWGMLAFIVTGFIVATSFAGTRASVVVDDLSLRQRVTIILVSNTKHYGGGLIQVAPQARLDDGLLDICLFEGEGPLSPVRHIVGMLTRQHLRDPKVSYYQARYLSVEARKPMPIHVDGVPAGETPLEVTLLPKSLHVLVPSKTRKNLFVGPIAQGISIHEFAG